MKKAVFLDRDGVIITEKGHYNYLPEHIDFVEDIAEVCQKLQQKGYLLIVITNQAGIAKGLYQHRHLRKMHSIIRDFFKSYGIKKMDFFYCPHHESQTNCLCRKPNSLLLEKAMAVYHIDPNKSYFVGDSERDEAAALKAGITPIRIEKNTSLKPYLEKNLFQ